MEKVIGVRFKKTSRLNYLNALEGELRLGDNIIAQTDKGEELGRVVKILNKEDVPEGETINKTLRKATKEDLDKVKQNDTKAKDALEFCKEEAKKLNLNMKVLVAEYTFDGTKLIIYFASEDRVDFRDLVKTLASKYRARIELRQIGPRDEIKAYPNLGMCGREVCCRTFLQNLDPVTIKMAKEQGLQINMPKLSGACGKLMCCLRYEEESYKENLKKLPKVGEFVSVDGEEEQGKVTGVDILGLKVKIRFGNTKEDERFEMYPAEKVHW